MIQIDFFFVFAGFINPIYQLFGRQVIFTVLSFLPHHFTYIHSKSSVTPDLVYFKTADYCKKSTEIHRLPEWNPNEKSSSGRLRTRTQKKDGNQRL
jgi:hypothetical protein